MPVGSYEPIFTAAIKSATKQTLQYKNFIFVIDTSTEEEYLKCKNIASGVDRNLILRTPRLGQGKARQLAIENSKSKYIAFLDSDDIWHPLKMELQINSLERNKATFSFTSYRNINTIDNSILVNVHCNKKISLIDLFISCPIANSSVTCRRDIFNKKFRFSGIKKRCDYATWLRIYRDKKPKTSVLSDYLVLISKRPNSISSNYWISTSGVNSIINAYKFIGFNNVNSILIGITFSFLQIFVKINRKLNIFKPKKSSNVIDYSYESFLD